MPKKQNSQQTPKHLQILFVSVLVATAIIETIVWISRMASQYPHNQNLSGFHAIFMTTTVLPLVMATTAYLLARRKVSVLQRSFDSIIVVILSLMLFGFLNLVQWGLLSLLNVDVFVWEALGSLSFAALSAALVYAIMTGYLMVARRKGQW